MLDSAKPVFENCETMILQVAEIVLPLTFLYLLPYVTGPGEKPLIFISYSSMDERLVEKIKGAIDNKYRNKYDTWMAKFDMQGAPLTSMGENLDRASLVILCVSATYEASKYCLSEASMSFNGNKEMIVLIMKENYDPTRNKTLNPIVTLPMRISCFSDKHVEASLEKIFSEIENGIAKWFICIFMPYLLLFLFNKCHLSQLYGFVSHWRC